MRENSKGEMTVLIAGDEGNVCQDRQELTQTQ